MECLLDFMYRGSIDVAEEHLPSLIKTATDLEIRGLSGDQRNQENNRSPYTRVEARMQRCHIETRVHTTEYIKEPSVIPFLPKQSSVESLEDHIKVEEIEVEDDPMVIDGHEDSFDEPLRSSETQINRTNSYLATNVAISDIATFCPWILIVGRFSLKIDLCSIEVCENPMLGTFSIISGIPKVSGFSRTSGIPERVGIPKSTGILENVENPFAVSRLALTNTTAASQTIQAHCTTAYTMFTQSACLRQIAPILVSVLLTHRHCVVGSQLSSFLDAPKESSQVASNPAMKVCQHSLKNISRRMPPPMYKRETRFKGQKRVSVGRSTRNSDPLDFRAKERIISRDDSTRDESYEDSPNAVKSEPNFNNGSVEPTVSDTQMNDDLQERDTSLDSSKRSDDNPRLTVKKKSDILTKRAGLNEGKDSRPILPKSEKAQYKPFSCDLCTLAFTRASHLARHRRVHTGERPFACSICPRMFARQDKLKQHLDSHLQWPKRKNSLSSSSCHSAPSVPGKGKRGRPRKVNLEQSAMEEILKFGEFSSLLNKSHSANSADKSEDFASAENDGKDKEQEEDTVEQGNEDKNNDSNKDKDNYGCQVENGQDII
ncbi:Zinc finger protein MSN2 [Habropoda laboriosa]|uniref:Zinc finger protein MSN2 n=1 Tax=Habropoda laboriosa TaxID=597456 RepID=A0A0L7RKP9_9HYME|nr:Zinc finger protein MSN2 [Habropoda laboriosa]